MQIMLDRSERTPLYMQIRNQIVIQITTGQLVAGSRLPSERTLALQLGINRSTVVRAYEELAADGLVEARVGRGTMVSPGLAPSGVAGAGLLYTASADISSANRAGSPAGRGADPVRPFAWQPALSRSGHRLQDGSLAAILNMLAGPNVISFAGGVPDPSFYPLDQVRASTQDILEQEWATALDYSATAGLPVLRSRLAEYLSAQGFPVAAEQILICSGSQQGLDILARVLLEPGDSIIIEEPSYIGAINAFRVAGARLITVPVDRDGMRTDILEQLLSRHQPRFIYTMPSAHNPAACTMSRERRQQLIALASRYRIPIIEDDAYSSLYYGDEAPPPLAALDSEGLVTFLGSASKMLLPGLRIAWLAGSAPLIQACNLIKQVTDLHSASLNQLIIERLLQPAHLQPHLEQIRMRYREKRDAMLDALNQWAGAGISWTTPDCGVYIWVELPPQVNAAQLLVRTEARGVVFMPGAPFYPHGGGLNHMRISFSRHGPEEIQAGIRIICQEIRLMQEEPGSEAAVFPAGSNLHLL